MVVVVFVALICEMTLPQNNPHHSGVAVDLPQVHAPVVLPDFMREDAITIIIYRNGDAFFSNDLVRPERIPDLIRADVARGSERKVYIRVDARAYYCAVKRVIDAVHDAGLTDISFLAERRRSQVVQ